MFYLSIKAIDCIVLYFIITLQKSFNFKCRIQRACTLRVKKKIGNEKILTENNKNSQIFSTLEKSGISFFFFHFLTILFFSGLHVLDQINHSAGISVLIVVPGDNLKAFQTNVSMKRIKPSFETLTFDLKSILLSNCLYLF